MKKLLILTAILVASVAANAASFKWTGANIYGSDATTKFTGTAAIYAFITGDTIDTAVKVVDVGVNAGTIKNGSTTGYTYEWSGAVVGNNYSFFMVIEDGDKTFNSSISEPAKIVSGQATVASTTTVGFANTQSATQNASNWASSGGGGEPVPEPTSGLLLLLGMAGLALKRKRA